MSVIKLQRGSKRERERDGKRWEESNESNSPAFD